MTTVSIDMMTAAIAFALVAMSIVVVGGQCLTTYLVIRWFRQAQTKAEETLATYERGVDLGQNPGSLRTEPPQFATPIVDIDQDEVMTEYGAADDDEPAVLGKNG